MSKKERNRNSVSLILEALEAEDGFVLCIHGRSGPGGAGGVFKIPFDALTFDRFFASVIERAFKEQDYQVLLRNIHNLLSDLISSIEATKNLHNSLQSN